MNFGFMFGPPKKGGAPHQGEVGERSGRGQGEVEEDQAVARGGVGEGFTPLPFWLNWLKVYKGSKD